MSRSTYGDSDLAAALELTARGIDPDFPLIRWGFRQIAWRKEGRLGE